VLALHIRPVCTVRPISKCAVSASTLQLLFNLFSLKGTGIVAEKRPILQDSPNSWDKMSQESSGEGIVDLPDFGSYHEYIDINMESSKNFQTCILSSI
jgi:hypothetical protein